VQLPGDANNDIKAYRRLRELTISQLTGGEIETYAAQAMAPAAPE
jgi:hypothetical protein